MCPPCVMPWLIFAAGLLLQLLPSPCTSCVEGSRTAAAASVHASDNDGPRSSPSKNGTAKVCLPLVCALCVSHGGHSVSVAESSIPFPCVVRSPHFSSGLRFFHVASLAACRWGWCGGSHTHNFLHHCQARPPQFARVSCGLVRHYCTGWRPSLGSATCLVPARLFAAPVRYPERNGESASACGLMLHPTSVCLATSCTVPHPHYPTALFPPPLLPTHTHTHTHRYATAGGRLVSTLHP